MEAAGGGPLAAEVRVDQAMLRAVVKSVLKGNGGEEGRGAPPRAEVERLVHRHLKRAEQEELSREDRLRAAARSGSVRAAQILARLAGNGPFDVARAGGPHPTCSF